MAYESISSAGWTSTASLAINKPTGLAVGDLMVACIYGNTGTSDPTFPTGFSKIITLADSTRLLVYTKLADADDVGASTFTWAGMSSNQVIGCIYRFSDARVVSIYSSSLNTGSSSLTRTFGSVSVTPPNPNSILVSFFGGAGLPSTTTISSYAVANNNPTWTALIGAYEAAQDRVFGTAYGSYPQTTTTGALTVVISGPTVETSDDFFGALLVIDKVQFSTSENLALAETATAAKGYLFQVAETLGLIEVTSFLRGLLTLITETISPTEYWNVSKWINQNKTLDTWSGESKPTTTFTKQNKSSSTWTEQNK